MGTTKHCRYNIVWDPVYSLLFIVTILLFFIITLCKDEVTFAALSGINTESTDEYAETRVVGRNEVSMS